MDILNNKPIDYMVLGYNLRQFNPLPRFINDMMPSLVKIAIEYGIDPLVMVAQSGKETGFGAFTRSVLPTFYNTCGLKIYDPKIAGDQESTLAHAQFASWDAGAIAHAQHLYAYLQMPVPGILLDPRYVHVFKKKTPITTVEQLGGSWAGATNLTYGTEIVDIVNKLTVRP